MRSESTLCWNMLSAKEQREARRRKILERGSDRLAYISGQVKTLQQAKEPAKGGDTGTGFQLTPPEGFDADATSKLLKDVQTQMEALDLGLAEEEPPRAKSISGETVPGLGREEPVPAAAAAAGLKQGTEQELRPPAKGSRFGALKVCRVWSQSMSATESARALFATLLALLVVGQALLPCELSSHDWMRRGFYGWPLSLILVTDVTLCLGVMLLGRGGRRKGDVQEAPVPADDTMLPTLYRLGDQLEAGMNVFQTMKAITMDWSIYLVVLICAFSSAQYFNVPVCFRATPQFITL